MSLQPAGSRPRPFVRGADGETGDRVFKFVMLLCGLAVLGMLVLIVYELVLRSGPSWHAFGFKFFATRDWDPVNEQFGAMPFIYGTLVSSLLALLIAVPLSIGVAVFTTEMCPYALRGPLSFFVELLAAIPSVVYGLWAIFVLVPLLSHYVQPFLSKTFGWTGFFTGPPYGISMLAAGIILAIMIIPIISSITREVLMVVPQHQREAALALGATRWEMIRLGVLRNARAGIMGGIILGPGPRTGRNHGRHHGDRQPSGDCEVVVRSRIHHGQRARQRVQRSHRRCLPLGLDRNWPGFVPGYDRGQRAGPIVGLDGNSRPACEGQCLRPAQCRSKACRQFPCGAASLTMS